jgi:hypothetical protein
VGISGTAVAHHAQALGSISSTAKEKEKGKRNDSQMRLSFNSKWFETMNFL